jgi:signal transduction histidine kinase
MSRQPTTIDDLSAFANVLAVTPLGGMADVIRVQFTALAGCRQALFFSSANAGALGYTFRMESGNETADQIVELGYLAKWLRVNERVLLVSDEAALIDDLPAHEREWMQRRSIGACVPLTHHDELLAVIFLVECERPWKPSRARLSSLGACAALSAHAWRHVLHHRQSAQETDAAYRSQQLATTGQLAASVAHEVRNPLAGIRSLVQLVRDAKPAADKHERLLSDVLTEIDRVDHTVAGLLGLARRHQPAVSSCDMRAVAQDAASFMQTFARRNGIDLVADMDTRPIVVTGDPLELRQVLLNVLLNACQACVAGGTVRVSADSGGSEHGAIGSVDVRDTGAGIAPRDLARVFEPFFTTKATGTGLGLGVSRELLRRHGGDMRIESTLGVGTRVTLQLPLEAEDHGPHSRR